MIEVNSPTMECLVEYFRDNTNLAEDVLANIPSRTMPNGFGIPYGRLKEVYDVINNRYNCTIKVFKTDELGQRKYICNFPLAAICTNIFNQREKCELGTIDGAQLALDMMRNFLEEGSWHYGLISRDGTILKNIEEWPEYPKQPDGQIRWIKDDKELCPIIWFGIEGQSPIECWSLYERENIRNIKTYSGKYDTKIEQECWKHFWFCKFWTMDWSVLWNNDETAIIWAFSEWGMDEPEEEFGKVRNDCPIDLLQVDSTDDMLDKVRKFCYNMQKKHVLEKSIHRAGYEAGMCFADLNKNGVCLEDGRPNPVWLNENFCDMLSESLYGDNQADDIIIDERYFDKEDFEGPYSSGNHWNVLERYIDNVEDFYYAGWYEFLEDEYGEDWEKHKTKY